MVGAWSGHGQHPPNNEHGLQAAGSTCQHTVSTRSAHVQHPHPTNTVYRQHLFRRYAPNEHGLQAASSTCQHLGSTWSAHGQHLVRRYATTNTICRQHLVGRYAPNEHSQHTVSTWSGGTHQLRGVQLRHQRTPAIRSCVSCACRVVSVIHK